EKLYQWIRKRHEEGSRMTAADIVNYLQNEIDNGGDDSSASPTSYLTSNNLSPAPFTSSAHGIAARQFPQADQPKNSVFSNALSSPVRQSLQPFHLAQGGDSYAGGAIPPGSGTRNNDDSREANSNDSSMDMHSDSPAHNSY
ncbi:hypothetical protein HPP92_000588, partial [Vanilla planifolia]